MPTYPTYKLGKIAKIYNGNSINAEEKEKKYKGVDGRNYIGTKDIEFDCSVNYNNGVRIPFDEKKFKIAPAGSVLVCAEGGSAGKKSAFITEDVCFGNKLFAITNNQGLFDGKYVFYYTRYKRFFDLFKNELSGLIGGVSSKKFGEIPISLPPLPTQHAIVTRIESLFAELDKAAEHLRTAQQQIKIYRQAVLNQMLNNEDGKWKVVKLGEICSVLGDGLHGTPKFVENGDFYFINGNNLNGVIVIKQDTKTTNLEEFEKYKKNLNERTILISINGTLGNIAYYNGEPVVLGKSACYFNLLDGIEKDYVKYCLLSERFRSYAFKNATGSTIKNVPLKAMRMYSLPLPPLTEQQRIVKEIESRLSQATATETYIENALQQAEALRQSILKKAFGGELV